MLMAVCAFYTVQQNLELIYIYIECGSHTQIISGTLQFQYSVLPPIIHSS